MSECRTERGGEACQPDLTCANGVENGGKIFPDICFPSRTTESRASGSSARRSMPHTGPKVLFHGWVLRERGKNSIKDGVSPNAVQDRVWSKLRSSRPMRLCSHGSGEDITCSAARWFWKKRKASLFSRYVLLRAVARHAVNDKRRERQLPNIGGGLPERHHLLR